MRSKTKLSIGLLLVGALLLPACGSGEVLGPPDSTPGDPLLQIHSEGGFVPVEWNLGNGPTFTVTNGGEFVFPGVTTLEYPGRLVPSYFSGQLNDDQMARVIELLTAMGIAEIDDEHDDSVDNVADASTEVIRFWDENGVHKYSVYALGITDDPASETTAAFADLVDYLHELVGTIESTEYQPERVRVVAGTYQGGFDSDFERIEDWPLEGENPDEWETFATIAEDGWTCKAFDGTILDVFADARQTTIYTHPDDSGGQVQLLVRPLHPGEADCAT
ncbi:MAG: hypothetical protein ACFCU2_03835 [Acidimicrobiia bacterium]